MTAFMLLSKGKTTIHTFTHTYVLAI